MDLTELIKHPGRMDSDTLYELRSILALYPYFQTARLLMLQNLYILHDPAFGEELRKAAIYITDRKVVFDLIEAAHYTIRQERQAIPAAAGEDRTTALIDSFLETIPKEQEEGKKRKPTPADAAVDYVAYLLETEGEEEQKEDTPKMKGQDLIDDFIIKDDGKFDLKEKPEYLPEAATQKKNGQGAEAEQEDDSYFTETLAKIYIKQGRYEKALEIMEKLQDKMKGKTYYQDQVRFLKKLVIASGGSRAR